MSKSNVGVALTKCYFCGEDDQIVLNTRLTERDAANVKAMHGMVINMDPCNKCKGFMKQGVILLTIDAAKSEPGWNKPSGENGWIPNPYRTGGFFVVRDEGIRKMLPENMAEWAIKNRFMFIEHEAAEKLGLFAAKPVEAAE